MNRSSFLARLLFLAPILLGVALLRPAPVDAQYIYIDTNGDGVHTDADALEPSGTTTLTFWLDTQHDRDGSLQTCNSHTGAPHNYEGAPPDPGLDIFSYDIRLLTAGGTLTWGTYEDNLGFIQLSPDLNSENEFHAQRFVNDVSDVRPAGLYKLGEMTVGVLYGTPSIRFGLMSETGAGEMTQFGTHCSASQYESTYLYGTDWFDGDGIPGGVGATPGGSVAHLPEFPQPAPITVVENHPVDVTITASDGDGDPLSFEMHSGPTYTSVSTVQPGTGQGIGQIHLAPQSSDVGRGFLVVRVTDGTFRTDQPVSVTVRRELELTPQADVSLIARSPVSLQLTAQNPLHHQITYYIVSGPPFLGLSQNRYDGWITMSPGPQDLGTYVATVGVTDGTLHDEKSFTILVGRSDKNHPPIAKVDGPVLGTKGRPVEFDASGSSDPDDDRLTFSWDFGDGTGALGGQRVAHRYATEGDYFVDLKVRDSDFIAVATVMARISPFSPARAYLEGVEGAIPGSVGADLCVRVEPVGGSFAYGDIAAGKDAVFSISTERGGRIMSTGLDIGTTTDGDRNGIADRGLLFSGSDVSALLAQFQRSGSVNLTVSGDLMGGGRFRAPLEITLARRYPGALAAGIAPNPMNPSGELSFVTTQAGRVDVRIFDSLGRLARRAIDGVVMPAGYHQVTIDGHTDLGLELPSGIYYYRIETREGMTRGRFAIVR